MKRSNSFDIKLSLSLMCLVRKNFSWSQNANVPNLHQKHCILGILCLPYTYNASNRELSLHVQFTEPVKQCLTQCSITDQHGLVFCFPLGTFRKLCLSSIFSLCCSFIWATTSIRGQIYHDTAHINRRY